MPRHGGRTIDEREREIIDLIAERLGGAFSIPSTWRVLDRRGRGADDNRLVDWEARGNESVLRSQSLPVVWRDRREPMVDGRKLPDGTVSPEQRADIVRIEKAAKSKDPAEKEWRPSKYQLAPRVRRDTDAIAAVSFARLAIPHEAVLMLYATGEVLRYWPTVKLYGLRGNLSPAHVHAITDAMQVILAKRADVAQDDRAKSLHMRASAYRALRAEYQGLLWGWIRKAANSYAYTLTGLSIHQILVLRDRDLGTSRSTTTTPDGLGVSPLLQTTVVCSEKPANDEPKSARNDATDLAKPQKLRLTARP